MKLTVKMKLLVCALIFITFLSSGCGNRPDKARNELAKLNIEYSEDAFFKAIQSNDTMALSLFLDAGMGINVKSDLWGTPLTAATIAGKCDTAKLLIEKGADVEATDSLGKTPLVASVYGGNIEITKLLLEKGAKINGLTSENYTALMTAVFIGNLDFVKLFLDNGADTNIISTDDSTALTLAIDDKNEALANLLIENGTKLDYKTSEHKFNYLELAILSDMKSTTQKLIEYNADVNALDDKSNTPLMAAASKGYSDIVQMMLDKGARINAVDSEGTTALMDAISAGHTDTAKLLIEKGADTSISQNNGMTAFLLAKNMNAQELVKILEPNSNIASDQPASESEVKALSVKQATSLLSKKFPDSSVENYPEFDFKGDNGKYYYYFEIVNGTSAAGMLYVEKDTGKLFINSAFDGSVELELFE